MGRAATLRKVTIDKEISMVMMSPPGFPDGSLKLLNPLRWLR